MDLQELKEKFRHKTKADLSDLDLALRAVPFLVRKLESLEDELSECDKRVKHFEQQLNKRRPSSYKGKKDGAEWFADLDDKKNILRLSFSGTINHRTAKLASNMVNPIFANIRKGCNVIFDVSTLTGFSNRVMFHFRKILYTLDVMGVERVIQVLPPDDTAVSGAFRAASEPLGFQVFSATSMAEAESVIEKSASFLKA
jgi:hypothetical protein